MFLSFVRIYNLQKKESPPKNNIFNQMFDVHERCTIFDGIKCLLLEN